MKEQIAYINLRIQFDSNPFGEVIEDMHVVSQPGKGTGIQMPSQSALHQPYWLFDALLQRPELKRNRGLLQQCHGTNSHNIPIQKGHPTLPAMIALIYKPLFEGTSRKEQEKQGMQHDPVYGTHVIACTSQKAIMSMLINYILMLPTFTAANKQT